MANLPNVAKARRGWKLRSLRQKRAASRRNRWGAFVGYGANSMSVKVDDVQVDRERIADMSGSGLSVKGFF